VAKGRKTGGRKPGSLNRKTIRHRIQADEGIRAALESGITPLEIVLRVARGGPEADAIDDRQLSAAIAALPFVHPKLAALHHQYQPPLLGGMAHEERLAMLERGPEPPELEGSCEEVPASGS
jgi:hypothetical protein